MPSPSKNKGNSWEREVAADLTKLFGEPFIRAPGSGAYTGGANTVRKQYLHEGQIRSFKGDIIPGQSFPRMNAECKNYGSFAWHQLFLGEVKQLETWLDQLMTAADEGDFNILICKITRQLRFVAIQDERPIFQYNGIPHIVYTSRKYGNWVICEYDYFWKLNAEQFANHCAADYVTVS